MLRAYILGIEKKDRFWYNIQYNQSFGGITKMTICLIRHGETDWNVIGRLQGREDIPLNENGMLQAEQCGKVLSKRNWNAIITSPLLRARQTTDIIADILKIKEVHENYDLVERDYGKASGLLESERKELFPDGKYEGIENWDIMRDRVCGAIIKSADMFYPENIIIISHGSAINSVLAELSNHTIGTGKTKLKNACINLFSYAEKSLKMELYNISHNEFF